MVYNNVKEVIATNKSDELNLDGEDGIRIF